MSAIEAVLTHYHPEWEPPDDLEEWNAGLCPAHDEARPSFRISFQLDACRCLACGYGGSPVSIVMREEGLGYAAALARAQAILVERGESLPDNASGKPGRRTTRRKRSAQRSRAVRPWLRA